MSTHLDGVGPQSEISSASTKRTLYLADKIGRISYTDALRLQHQIHDRCVAGEIPGVLLLLEHDPVITLGVNKSSHQNVLASPEALRSCGVQLVETDRGGDATYHGPGQVVGYPVVPLRKIGGGDLHGYLRGLEETVIRALAQFGLDGVRNGPAGVWVGGLKVCSIGVAVRKWVTYHGFALNVDPMMEHFALINPCGLDSTQVTSMAALLGEAPDIETVRAACAHSFAQVFDVNLDTWCPELC